MILGKPKTTGFIVAVKKINEQDFRNMPYFAQRLFKKFFSKIADYRITNQKELISYIMEEYYDYNIDPELDDNEWNKRIKELVDYFLCDNLFEVIKIKKEAYTCYTEFFERLRNGYFIIIFSIDFNDERMCELICELEDDVNFIILDECKYFWNFFDF